MTGPDCAVMCNLINIHTYIPILVDVGKKLCTIILVHGVTCKGSIRY